MNDIIPPGQKEIRIPGSNKLTRIIKSFGATEKFLFGVLSLLAGITALYMLWNINQSFMVPVPARGGEHIEGVVGFPRFINPILALTDTDRDLTNLIYSGLMKYENGKIVPDLARSYTISEDGLVYTFTLKDTVKFHDGTSVTSDDIEFTILKAQDSTLKSPRRAAWEGVVVEKVDARQIKFILKKPYTPFLDNTTIGILPKHIWKNVEGSDQFTFSQFNIEPIGSGPYKIEDITRDNGGLPQYYTLVPYSKYATNAPYISTITVHFYPNEKTLIEALTRGDIQAIHGISPKEAATISEEQTNSVVERSPLPRIFGVFFNQNQAPVLANKEVRQALNIAVDREAIVQEVLNGYGIAIDSPLPSSLATPRQDSVTSSSTERIAEARAILEKAGWTLDSNGIYVKKSKTATQVLSFSISTTNAPELKRAAELVQETWKKVGADVTVRVFESGDLSQNIIRPRKFDALLFGEVIGRDLDLYGFWHSSQRNGTGLNIAMYINAKADKLLEDARIENDEKARIAKYHEFESIIRDDIPAVFLYSPEFIYITPKTLKGVAIQDITMAADRWNNVRNWYIRTDNVWKIFVADTTTQ
ncbi:MAG: hypothetical protein HZA80_02265 [Candidatus Taylorbacteria bacterium]|nr:hypothetical protein [Candidatus Taylorbacteria bacterium]